MEHLPSSAQGVCEACGRTVLRDDLTPWPVEERRRTFVGKGGEGEGGGLFRYEDIARDYAVCTVCRARLEAGETFQDIVGRRTRNQIVIFIAVAIAILVGAVAFLPTLLSALWRTGGPGQ